ncbi:gamma carbonic anhydrase family protein [Paraferrimonas sedimenticola]|uniref:Gamma carbonic anhydrase family protein n=1 Tax=Paraferrimonas sedimenticola TaxID=375674 RepID=A0AA37W279_9GAMM|nr:gamma carbonic anhydrase family protein [Paraferrimonas sedimenticola]GLP97705.1 gamma carbonic anhydrase family protein [Paraferrimonas sedimenticola]
MSKSIRTFKNKTPVIGEGAYVDESSVLAGDVTLGKDVSIWPLVAARGDVNWIRIGDRTNIQDGSVLHVSRESSINPDGYPLDIGADVTVGHKAMLHGCRIGDRVLVGMGAIVLDGVIVEDEVIIGAGTLVPPGKRLESGYLYVGSPAKQIRELSEKERGFLKDTAAKYVELKEAYSAES